MTPSAGMTDLGSRIYCRFYPVHLSPILGSSSSVFVTPIAALLTE
jgi:hypothetical protein